MGSDTVVELERLPPVAPAYWRALTNRKGGLAAGEGIPRIEVQVSRLTIERSALARYNRVCGYADYDYLPPTYLHVLAFPVHMAALTQPAFPFRLLGLVHVGNEITQHRRVGVDEILALRVHTGAHRDNHNGTEFDLVTEALDQNEACVWRSNSSMLSRGGGAGQRGGGRVKPRRDAFEHSRVASWHADADIGRRYARASGDINPIHLSAFSAKLFGFPRAIAHGMWLKARTAAEIAGDISGEAFTMRVAFKKPVLLPSRIMCRYLPSTQGVEFLLASTDAETVHMAGAVTYG